MEAVYHWLESEKTEKHKQKWKKQEYLLEKKFVRKNPKAIS